MSSPLTTRRAHAAVCMLYNRINLFSLAEGGQAASAVAPIVVCNFN